MCARCKSTEPCPEMSGASFDGVDRSVEPPAFTEQRYRWVSSAPQLSFEDEFRRLSERMDAIISAAPRNGRFRL